MVKYVVAVQAVSKRWAWAGRQVGRLVRRGTRSAIMDGLVQAREQGGKCKSWLGKFAKWLWRDEKGIYLVLLVFLILYMFIIIGYTMIVLYLF
jgi:hypothetical protein